METEIIVGTLSGVVAVLIASLSYLHAKRMKFFETFFHKKTDAFEKYIDAVSSIPRTEDELYQLASISRTATLYCFERNKTEIESLLDLIIKAYQKRNDKQIPEEIQEEFRELRKEVISSLRDEIQSSKKFRFY